MCQCLPCECWWCNFCGVCGGLAELWLCIGFWCCKPHELKAHNSDCCYCFETAGCGGNFFCYGGVCCAPQWLQNYAKNVPAKNNQNNGQSMQQFGGRPNGQQPYGQQPYGQQPYGNPYPPTYNQGGVTVIHV